VLPSSDDGIRKTSGITGVYRVAQSPLMKPYPPGRDAALYVAGSPDEREADEPGQPNGPRRDAGEYDAWGEANHKSGVKIA
jgi:hypothetical protein